MFSMANIGDWITGELIKRDWSQADLSRKAGLSRAAISNLISGNRGLGKDTTLAIAKAFDILPDDVLRAAGDLPQLVDDDPTIRDAIRKFSQLDEYDRLEIIETMKTKIRLAKSRGKNEKVSRPTK